MNILKIDVFSIVLIFCLSVILFYPIDAYPRYLNKKEVRNYVDGLNKHGTGKNNGKTGSAWLRRAVLNTKGKMQLKYPSLYPPTVLYEYVEEDKKLLGLLIADQEIGAIKESLSDTSKKKAVKLHCDSQKGKVFYSLLQSGYAIIRIYVSPEGWILYSYMIKPNECNH